MKTSVPTGGMPPCNIPSSAQNRTVLFLASVLKWRMPGLTAILLIIALTANAQNDCASPVVISSIPFSSGALTTCGTVDNFPAGSYFNTSYGGGEDYVFSLNITSAPVTYIFSLGGAATWKIASVHTACPPANANSIGGIATSSGSSATGNVTFTSTGVHYIFIDTWPAPACGAFTLDISIPPPPPGNDDCINATALTVNPDLTCTTSATGTTVSATQSAETAPSCGSTGVNDDVWYTFTATSTAHIFTISNITGSLTDMAMAIYSGDCGSLTHIQCSDPNTMTVTGLTIGTIYKLRIWTFSSAAGGANFTICITTPPPPPVNDDCSGALELTANPDILCGFSLSGTTTSATQSTGTTPTCNATGINDDVWYRFTANAAAMTLTLSGATNATAAQVYSGSCASLVTVACGSTSSGVLNLNLTSLSIGSEYKVRVYTTSTAVGTTSNFTICVGTTTIPNDEPAGAISLSPGMPQSIVTVLATQTLPACNGTADDDVWFVFTPPASGAYTIAFAGLTGTTDIGYEIFQGLPAGGISLACHDGPDTGASLDGFVTGTSYYIRVYSWTSTTTTDITGGTITITNYSLTPPSNNGCASPIGITPSANGACTYTSLNSTNATYSLLKPSCITSLNPPAHDDDIWVSFTASVSGPHVFKTQAGGTYGIEAYTGSCNTLTPVASSCSTSFTGTTGFTIALTSGTTYLVRVWRTSTGGAAFDLCVEMPLACSVPTSSAATMITATTAQANWTCVGCTGSYIIEYGPSATFNMPGMGLTPGPNGTIITAVAGSTNVSITNLSPSTQYRYFVRQDCTGSGNDYSSNSTGILFTTQAPPPANDDCSGAVTLTVNANLTCTSTTNGTTAGATASNETAPSCGASGTNDDVWFSFTAISTVHNVVLSNVSSGTDMGMAVYSGNCGSLVQVACSDPNTLSVSALTIGQLYNVRVWTWSATVGVTAGFTICVSTPPPPPVNDVCSGAIVIPTNQGWPYVTPGTDNTNATNTGDPSNTCQSNSNKGIWYSLVPSVSGSWNFSLCQSDAPLSTVSDNVIAIFSSANGCAGPLTEIDCDDDNCTTLGLQAIVDANLTSGTQYYILAYSYSTNMGVMQMKVTPPATPLLNDDATGAIALTVDAPCTGNIYSNVGGSFSPGEPYPNCSTGGVAPTWFKFVAPSGGAVRISTDFDPPGTFDDSNMALYSASDPADYATFSLIACDEDGGIQGDELMSVVYATGLTPGITYYVVIDAYDVDVEPGTFCLTVETLDNTMLSSTNTCLDFSQFIYSGDVDDFTGWFNLIDEDGKLMAMIKDADGLDAADFEGAQNVHTGPVRQDGTGQPYLDRNWFIDDAGFGYSNVSVRLFFTDAEFAALQAANPSISDLSQLKVTKTNAVPDECANNFNNASPTLLSQTGNGSTGGVSWIEFVTPSFSNFFIHGGLTALPVNLLSFDGLAMTDYNKVMWYTESETNFDQFEVQRASSVTGQFITIGSVKGGYRSGGDYIFEDKQPLTSGFYRLKMMDLDGQFTFSKVINIKRKGDTFAVRNVFPNPVTDVVNIELTSPEIMEVDLRLLDVTGKEVRMVRSNLSAGDQTIPFSMQAIQPGTYFIHVMGQVSKVVKL